MQSLRNIALVAGVALIAACSDKNPSEPQDPPVSTVSSVHVTPATNVVAVGATKKLSAVARDAQGDAITGRTITWGTAASTIATVDAQGTVTGLSAGTARISATVEGKSGGVDVVVQASSTVPVYTVSIAPAPDTVEAWTPVQMQAILKDEQGAVLGGRVVRWTSSHPATAAINETTGELTGFQRGTVTITATSEGKTGTVARVVVIKYRSISAGTMHVCDIASGGFVWCWGLNGNEGRIGSSNLGATAFRSSPSVVPGTGPASERITQLSSFGSHTCGLTAAGKAMCWGYNGWNQLGVPNTTSSSFTPVDVLGGHSFKQISVGGDHSCGVTQDGRAYCWGRNDWRQFATPTPAPGSSATPVAVVPNERFQTITAGTSFTCGTAVNGTSYCWGSSGLGQLGDGTQISYGNTFTGTPVSVTGQANLKGIDAGNNYVCAVGANGDGFCWGSNGGKLGHGGTAATSVPTMVGGGINFQSIATGNAHTCGVATDASLWCWGANGNGQLGAVSANGSVLPMRAGGALLAAEVAPAGIATGSGAHTCAIAADRLTVYCFGRNDMGQLGNGATTSAVAVNSTPVIVVGQKPD